MHAVVVNVTINDEERALSELRENVVPNVSQIPGFVTGHWTKKDNDGLSMVIFDSEDVAKEAGERVPQMVSDAVTVNSVEVREVTGSA
jgi:hypothetical protein